jgi:hypothetical protein
VRLRAAARPLGRLLKNRAHALRGLSCCYFTREGEIVAAQVDAAGTADDAIVHLQDRNRVYLGGAVIGNGLDTEIGADAVDFATGDVDGDGVLDVVVCTIEEGSELMVLIGGGDGQFTATDPLAQPGCALVAVADFNGDGLGDIAIADAADGISLRFFEP